MARVFFLAEDAPTTFYCALLSSASAVPTVDTNTMADVTEITAANGYTSGGVAVPRAEGGGATATEDDTNNRATFLFRDIGFTADGGAIPSTSTVRYAVITTDEGTVANRQIIAVIDIGDWESCPDGKVLTLSGFTIRINEP